MLRRSPTRVWQAPRASRGGLAMVLVSCLASWLVAPRLGHAETRTAAQAILGGKEMYNSSVVALLDPERKPICSGTIIDSNVVLTAAHCLAGPGISAIRLAADATAPAIDVLVTDSLAMPEIGLQPRVDVALLLLAETVNVERAVMAKSGQWPNPETVRVAGYGLTESAELGIQHERQAPVMHVDRTFFRHGESSCSGDSGGAVFWDSDETSILVGVISSGPADCKEYATAVRVDHVRPWIEDVLNDLRKGGCTYLCARVAGGCQSGPAAMGGWLFGSLGLLARRRRRARRDW